MCNSLLLPFFIAKTVPLRLFFLNVACPNFITQLKLWMIIINDLRLYIIIFLVLYFSWFIPFVWFVLRRMKNTQKLCPNVPTFFIPREQKQKDITSNESSSRSSSLSDSAMHKAIQSFYTPISAECYFCDFHDSLDYKVLMLTWGK